MNDDSKKTVLVLGARGRLGQAAVHAFGAAGWRVLAQVRARAGVVRKPGQIDLDLHETQALVEAARTATVVVYAVNPPYTDWATQLLPLARAGMAAAQALGATFMLPGNVYAYGKSMPALLSESTPEAPSDDKGLLRQQLEAELAERGTCGTLKSVVIRAGDFFGPATGTWIDQMIAKQVLRGKPKLSYPGPLQVPHAWAYLPDLARTFVAVAGAQGLPLHSRWHFEGHTLCGAELLLGLEQVARDIGLLGMHARVVHAQMSWTPVRAIGLVLPLFRELARMRYLYEVPHALDGRALQARFGPLTHTPLSEALRSTLQFLAARGAPKSAAALQEQG